MILQQALMCKYCFSGNGDPTYEHRDWADAEYF